jgi:uncharacterized protein
MTNPYYQTAQTFRKTLESLAKILDIASEHIIDNQLDEGDFLNASLAPDMLPLTRQVQIACDGIKGFVGRLTGEEMPRMEDTESNLGDLIKRISSTIELVDKYPEEKFSKADQARIVLPWMASSMPGKYLKAEVYLYQFAIPNIYFHLVTAYDIVRSQEVSIGKMDYIGQLELTEV